MQDQEVVDQARFIMTSGRRIWEWVFKIQADQLADGKEDKTRMDLSMAQYQVLLLLNRQKTMTISELAARLGVSVPSASAMVERLVDRGVLRRRQAEDDRRKVEVFLTQEALQKVSKIESIMIDSFLELVASVGEDTARKWCEVLQKVETCLPGDAENNSERNKHA